MDTMEKTDIRDKADELLENYDIVPKWEIVADFKDFMLYHHNLDISDEQAESYLQDIFNEGN